MILLFLIVLILAGAGIVYETVASRQDAEHLVPPGSLVEVSGVTMHLNCSGTAPPTILLESGLGDSALVWADVQARLAQFHRVCSYDRAGIGWSQTGAAWDARIGVEQLRALLERAGEPRPVVLVGHSAGANYALLFALLHPEDVRAVVLIEPPLLSGVSPIMVTALKGLRSSVGVLARLGVVRILGRLRALSILFGGAQPPVQVSQAAGFLYRPESIRGSLREVEALPGTIQSLRELEAPGALGEIPLLIVSAQFGSRPSTGLGDALQKLASLSRKGRVVPMAGSHFVHFDHPDLLVERINEVLTDLP